MRGVLLLLLLPAAALAEDVASEPAPTVESLQAELEQTKSRLDALEQRLNGLVSRTRFTGYADVGFFAPLGNQGSGVVQDVGNKAFPEFAGRFAWVFLGDLLAPTVNTRGEAADLGELPNARRFDSIHSRGASGFLINEVRLAVTSGIHEQFLLHLGVMFVPRTGSNFGVGDFIQLDLAQLEWLPFASGKVSVFAGKMESVLAIEYRERLAVNRFGITPSLIHRYTAGTPLGLKVRAKFFEDDLLTVAVAFTNGSSTTEQFHFYDEQDSNNGKTLSGRVSVKAPFIPGELELGASGEYGASDRARDSLHPFWLIGADLQWRLWTLAVKASVLRGMSEGVSTGVYGLRLNAGGYLELNLTLFSWLGILGRAEFRDAFVWLETERAYLTRSYRLTFGLRATLNENIQLKAEYLHNGEYGGVPAIANDVFTSSLVVSY